MNSAPRVTICTRTFERPALLERAVSCVVAQTFEDWELVIVNNGGDPSAVDELLERRADELRGRARALHVPAGTIGVAATVGFEAGTGEFLGLLDDDDTWFPEYLETMVDKLSSEPDDVAVVAGQVRRVTERLSQDGHIEQLSDEPFNPNLEMISFQSSFLSHPIATNSFVFRRSAFEAVGRFSAEVITGEDSHFLLKLLTRYRLTVVPEELGSRNERIDSSTGANMIHNEILIRDGDARYRDMFTESHMRSGEITPSRVASTVSVVDRQNLARVDEVLNRLRETRLHTGDALHNTIHAKEQLDGYDETFRAFRAVMSPVVALRRLAGRVARKGGGS